MPKKIAKLFYTTIHIIEILIAILTIVVLVGFVAREVSRMFTDETYFDSADRFLKNILTVVVGLEFVRMLINLTPANTIEVLIVAMARQVIISHNDPISNIVSIACIGGLFAIRRYLITKTEFKREISDDD